MQFVVGRQVVRLARSCSCIAGAIWTFANRFGPRRSRKGVCGDVRNGARAGHSHNVL